MYSNASFRPNYFRPNYFRSNDVTSGSLSVTEVTWRNFLHVTASYCKLQPCKKWNAQYTRVLGLLQPLPGDFGSNDVTSGSLPIIWGLVTSFTVMWLATTATYCLVGSETYSICKFWGSTATSMWLSVKWCHFRVTSGYLRPFDISCLVTASYCELQRCRKWNVYMQVFSLLQRLPGDHRSNHVNSGSLPITWGHVTSFLSHYCLLLRATAL